MNLLVVKGGFHFFIFSTLNLIFYMKKSALGYCRVSTMDQAEYGYGLEYQRSEIQKYCKNKGLELKEIYSDDGSSGADPNRPQLQELLSRAKNDKVDFIVIAHSSRLFRDSMLSEIVYRDLRKNNINLISTSQPNYYEADGDFQRKLIRTILSAFDEYERSLIAYRLRNGKRKKAELGGFHGGFLYGYRSINGQLEVNEQEAEVVRQIFALKKKKKMNLTFIADHLNKTGVKTRLRGHWHPSIVRAILLNPVYHGKIRFGGKEYIGIHKGLL
ncbi:MAG: hypothetical protein A2925_04835 [Candidatus Yanofskybacteria bacterium RIFCSPLOWO2_01_FULL_44_22]|uniref:Resolvase/invertase-type recombinase catalytic domain-containing protein n=2 Tax=Candidatus Yanofskyibacteriota TaxID=1752733 RepID=A0A1F8GKV4_9BACT|nr:MAG: hypothetical protein A2925_04835 [Candidatus Yanofskybacteria bacterium RIFCSPLOWO2_01_FULL_44_22]